MNPNCLAADIRDTIAKYGYDDPSYGADIAYGYLSALIDTGAITWAQAQAIAETLDLKRRLPL